LTVKSVVVLVVVPFCVKDTVIVVIPLLAVLAWPALLIVATVTLDEPQLAWFVRSIMLLSLKVPVAVKDTGVPTVTVGVVGLIAMDVKVAVDTVRVAGLFGAPKNTAVMLVVPDATPVASPSLGYALLTVATDGEDDAQFALVVRFC
jgi:hypothetical protein